MNPENITPELIESLIPQPIFSMFEVFLVIMMGIIFGIFTSFLKYRKRRQVVTLHHQERMAAIERGVELPPLPAAFFDEGRNPYSPRRGFALGLIWLLVGLALLVALHLNAERELTLYALIPIAVGLAYLIFYFAVGKKEADILDAERKAKTTEVDQSTNI